MDRNTFIKIRCYLILNPIKRTKYLIKKKVFNAVGKNFYFCPRKIPQDPMLIRFGDNVKVATDVFFVTHDIIHDMVNDIDSDNKIIKVATISPREKEDIIPFEPYIKKMLE